MFSRVMLLTTKHTILLKMYGYLTVHALLYGAVDYLCFMRPSGTSSGAAKSNGEVGQFRGLTTRGRKAKGPFTCLCKRTADGRHRCVRLHRQRL